MSLMSPSNTKKKTQRTSRIPSYTAVRGLDEVFVASDRSCICVRVLCFPHAGYKVQVLLKFWYVFQRFVFIFFFLQQVSPSKKARPSLGESRKRLDTRYPKVQLRVVCVCVVFVFAGL